MHIAVVMPVGPGDAEAARCHDTVASIKAYEPAVDILLVDDASGRSLSVPGTTTLSHPMPAGGRVEDRVAAATLAGFGWARDKGVDVAMKIDTDALAIAPFAEKLEVILRDSAIGLVGSYDLTCNGDTRSFRGWVRPILLAAIRNGRFRRALFEARRHGYKVGEHALGAAVAVPKRTLEHMPLEEPTQFVGTHLYDDPLLGVLVRQAGLTLAGAVDEVFGVVWRGLPDSPQRLLDRGFSIIHSVKNDPAVPESEIRAFFAERRGQLCLG